MKKFLYLFLAVALILSVSCASNNPAAPSAPNLMVGAGVSCTSSGGMVVVALVDATTSATVTGATVTVNGGAALTEVTPGGYGNLSLLPAIVPGAAFTINITSSLGGVNISQTMPAAGAGTQTVMLTGCAAGSYIQMTSN